MTMPMPRRRTIKKKTRLSPRPIAYNDVHIPDEIWDHAEREGNLRRGKHFRIKHTERLRDQVSTVLGRLQAELMPHRNLPSEGLMRAKLGRLEEALAICVPILADLSENNFDNGLVRRTVIKSLRKDLANYREKAEWFLVHLREQDVDCIEALLVQESSIQTMKDRADILLSAVKRAFEQSNAHAAPGKEGTLLADRLPDLACCYRQAGGRVTKGSSVTSSAFARWTFELLKCLPKELISLSVDEINTLVKNTSFKNVRKA